MKETDIQSGIYLFIEIPDDAYDIKLSDNNGFNYSIKSSKECFVKCFDDKNINNKFEIISTIKNITEMQCKKIVQRYDFQYPNRQGNSFSGYLNYEYTIKYHEEVLFDYSTAKESFKSLVRKQGLNIEKNYLIVKKIS